MKKIASWLVKILVCLAMLAAFLPLFILSLMFVYELNVPELVHYFAWIAMPGGLIVGLVYGMFWAVKKDWLKIGHEVDID